MLRKIILLSIYAIPLVAVSQSPGELPFKPEDFGIKKESKFYKQFSQPDEAETDEDTPVAALAPVGNIIERIERDEGVPIPQLVQPIKNTPEIRAKVEKAVNDNIKIFTNRSFAQRELPNCSENKTTKLPGMGFGKLDSGTLIADILYLRKHTIPEDPTEVFGPRVQIRPYEPDPKSVHFNTALGMGVSCLPYRIRITDSFTEKLEGKNALRNYSKDQTGKGFLHKKARKMDF